MTVIVNCSPIVPFPSLLSGPAPPILCPLTPLYKTPHTQTPQFFAEIFQRLPECYRHEVIQQIFLSQSMTLLSHTDDHQAFTFLYFLS